MGWSLSSHLNTKYIKAALPFDIWKQTISKKRRSRIAPYLCSIRKFNSRSTVLTGPRLKLCNTVFVTDMQNKWWSIRQTLHAIPFPSKARNYESEAISHNLCIQKEKGTLKNKHSVASVMLQTVLESFCSLFGSNIPCSACNYSQYCWLPATTYQPFFKD